MKKVSIIILALILVGVIAVVVGDKYIFEIPSRLARYHNMGEISLSVNGEKIDIDGSEVEWGYYGTERVKNGKFKFEKGSYGDNLFEYKIPGYEYVTVKFGIFNTNWWHVNKYDVNISVIDDNDVVYVEAEQEINSNGGSYTDKNNIDTEKGKKTDLWIYLGP